MVRDVAVAYNKLSEEEKKEALYSDKIMVKPGQSIFIEISIICRKLYLHTTITGSGVILKILREMF